MYCMSRICTAVFSRIKLVISFLHAFVKATKKNQNFKCAERLSGSWQPQAIFFVSLSKVMRQGFFPYTGLSCSSTIHLNSNKVYLS